MFKAKAENEIRLEVIEDLKAGNEEFNADEHKDQIDRITQRRLKDEQFKASVHKSKEEKKQKIAELENKLKGSGSNEDKKPEFVTKEEFEKTLNQTAHRNKYSWMQDDEYQLVKRESDSAGKSFEDTLKDNKVVKTYFQNIDIKNRQAGAIGLPSTMVDQEGPDSEEAKIAKSFDKNFPPGFGTKK